MRCDHGAKSPHGSIVYVRVNGELVWVGCRWCGHSLGKILKLGKIHA